MSELDKIRARAAESHGHGDYASWDDIEHLLSIIDKCAEHCCELCPIVKAGAE